MFCIGIISKDIELINELISMNNKVIIITKNNVNKYLNKKIDLLVIEKKILKNKEYMNHEGRLRRPHLHSNTPSFKYQ